MPVDHRTTDVGTYLEYASDRGFARVGYDGSFFRNNVTTLVWDNPSRITDSPTAGSSQGRMALWPNTEMNRSRVGRAQPPGAATHAFVSAGSLKQQTADALHINAAMSRRVARLTRSNARVTAMKYASRRAGQFAVVPRAVSPLRSRQPDGAVRDEDSVK